MFNPFVHIAENANISVGEAADYARAVNQVFGSYLNPDSIHHQFALSTPNQVLALDALSENIRLLKRSGREVPYEDFSVAIVKSVSPYLSLKSEDARMLLERQEVQSAFVRQLVEQDYNLPNLLQETQQGLAQRLLRSENIAIAADNIIEVQEIDGVFQSGDAASAGTASAQSPNRSSKPPETSGGFVARLRQGAQQAATRYTDFARDHKAAGFAIAGGEVLIGGTLMYRGGKQLYNAFGPPRDVADDSKTLTSAGKLWAGVQSFMGAALTGLGIYTAILAHQGRGR